MRNILLFGPPAAGKLTIAIEIANRLPYVVLDNHRTIDASNLINNKQSHKIPSLCEHLREWLYSLKDVNVVTTVVYAAGVDDELIMKYIHLLSRAKAPCLPVQLHCSQNSVRERCVSNTRTGTSKLVDCNIIDNLYQKFDFDKNHPCHDVVHLCTDNIAASQTCDTIIQYAQQGASADPARLGS